MIPINLGQRQAVIGGRMPQAPQRMPTPPQAQQAPNFTGEARSYGLSQALAEPIEIQSGGWGEALAEALAGGLRGRAARNLYAEELARNQAQTERENQSGDLENEQRRAQIEALRAETEQIGTPQWQPIPAPELPQGARFGQRNLRTGEQDLEWAPAPSAGAGGQPPSGYRVSQDGNLEAIPGGPADVRATAAGQSRRDMLASSARNLQNAIDVLAEADRMISPYSTGIIGQTLRGVGGSAAYDLHQQFEPVRAILSFENLAEMRRNSATGGALGSIAVRELDLLGSTLRSLDTAQSEEQVRTAAQTVQTQLQRTLRAVQAASAEMNDAPGLAQYGASAATADGESGTSGGNVTRYDAQGNRIP